MAVIGIKAGYDNKLHDFITKTRMRLKDNRFFFGHITFKVEPLRKEAVILFLLEPIFPKVYYGGFVLLIPALILTGLSIWVTPGLIVLASGFFWSKWFIYIIFRVALLKEGYNQKLKILSNDEVFKSVLRL